MAPKKSKDKKPQIQTPSRLTRAVARSAQRVTRSVAHEAAESGLSITFYEHDPPTKKAKKGDQEASNAASSKTIIVIEHCTQSDSFETKATELKERLVSRAPDITVKMNPKKPRVGCFEVRNEGGQKFISLLNLEPPFQEMMDLDMDKVILDIIPQPQEVSRHDQTS